MKRLVLLMLPVLLVLGCSDDKDDKTDKGKDKKDVETSECTSQTVCNSAATGAINNQIYSLQSGQAWLIHEQSGYQLQVQLWNKKIQKPCLQQNYNGPGLEVQMRLPNTSGNIYINTQNINYYVAFGDVQGGVSNYFLADSGSVGFQIVTDRIYGKVDARDGHNYVRGSFSVPYCGEKKTK